MKLLKSRIKKIFFVWVLILLYGSSAGVNATSIGISPKAITINQSVEDSITSDIFIHNTGDRNTLYDISADKWPQLISAVPNDFVLAPGESKQVSILFTKIPIGIHQLTLSVVAKDSATAEHAVKTGIKIPVDLEITGVSKLVNWNIWLIVMVFITLSLLFLLVAFLQSRHQSFWQKEKDLLQERIAKKSIIKLLMHYIRFHSLLVISGFSLICALIFLAWSIITPVSPSVNRHKSVFQESNTIELNILTDETNLQYKLIFDEHTKLSAFTALQQVSQDYGIPLSFDPPTEMGVFVTEVNGYRNGTANKYWVYEVNNESVPIASDRYMLAPNDKVVWKFVISE